MMRNVVVIIPVTRPEHFALCMDSLIRQTFPHSEFEIILVKRKDLVLELKDTDIKITQIEEDRMHPAFRRNIAVKKTNAEILAFVDDDTIPPVDWLQNAVRHIKEAGTDGICGPIVQSEDGLPFAHVISGAANESIFLEGVGHRIYKRKPADFYSIVLCNVMIKKNVWESVGGFNEVANYYIDDTEFFYLASRKGYKFYNIPDMVIQHAVEPFPIRYLKKTFVTRFHTGLNSIMFKEVYWNVPAIRLTLLAYPVMISLSLVIKNWEWVAPFMMIYFGLSFWFSYPWFTKNKKVFTFLPLVFFGAHATIFTAFTLGVLYFFIKRKSFNMVIEDKKKRLRNAGIV